MATSFKVTRPAAGIRAFNVKTLAVSEVSNPKLSASSGKSICFVVKPTAENGYATASNIELSVASIDQEEKKHSWFVDEAGKEVEVGKEAFLNIPEKMGLKEGRGVYVS